MDTLFHDAVEAYCYDVSIRADYTLADDDQGGANLTVPRALSDHERADFATLSDGLDVPLSISEP
jgi:hypothetical protein